MYLEIIAFTGIIALIAFFFAEWKQRATIGIFGGFLLILLGLFVIADGIDIRTGEIQSVSLNKTGSEINAGALNGTAYVSNVTNYSQYSENTNITGNLTGTETQYKTISNVYSKFVLTYYMPFPIIIGLIILLMGVYATFYYILEIMPH